MKWAMYRVVNGGYTPTAAMEIALFNEEVRAMQREASDGDSDE